MHSREFLPCPSLRRFVRLIWILELDDPSAFGPVERIVPDGLLEVVFHYRAPLVCRHAGEAFVRQPKGVAVSQTRRWVEIHPDGAIGRISVRFQPWGAFHFLGVPISELADRQVDVEHLWGQAAAMLTERLAAASGDLERVAVVEDFLLERLARHHVAEAEGLVRAVWARAGRGTVRELCGELGIGERRMERLCGAALGTTPKGFGRLCRFLNACNLLRGGGPSRGHADVALQCGYYDQSHFIAEFKRFSGMTPRTFASVDNVSFLDVG